MNPCVTLPSPLCRTGIRWSQRSSYCQYIPDVQQQPAFDSTVTYIDYDCVYPLNQIYINLAIQAAAWLVIALYLDNVWPSGSGQNRPLWYFLLPSYWANHRGATARHLRKTESFTGSTVGRRSLDTGRHSLESGRRSLESGTGSTAGGVTPSGVRVAAELHSAAGDNTSTNSSEVDGNVAIMGQTVSKSVNGDEDEDVVAEADKMKALLHNRITSLSNNKYATGLDPSARRIRKLQGAAAAADHSTLDLSVKFAVEVYGLAKVFKAPLSCSSCKGASAANVGDFWAIKGSWFGIEQGQLFCLLGPNGAGKTTTINCLTGQCWHSMDRLYAITLVYSLLFHPAAGQLAACFFAAKHMLYLKMTYSTSAAGAPRLSTPPQ